MDKDNLASPQYAGSKTWGKMEYNRVSDKELLVARSSKRCRKICRGIQYVLKDEEQDRDTSREVNDE